MTTSGNASIRYGARPNIVSVRHGDATVLLDASSGKYYTLNAVGSFIWDEVCKSQSIEDIDAALRVRYEVESESSCSDATAFIRSLAKRDLLVAIPS